MGNVPARRHHYQRGQHHQQPGLSQIPLLFFQFRYHENQQDEVVFILIPHIVRESVLTALNTRAIDTGTQTSIELRHSDTPIDTLFPQSATPPATPTTSAANAANAMAQQLSQQIMPPTPGNPAYGGSGRATPAAPGAPSLQPVSLNVAPPNSTHDVGSTFTASIVLSNAHDVYSVPLQVQFDPKILELVNVDTGGLLGGDGQPVALVHRDEGNGLSHHLRVAARSRRRHHASRARYASLPSRPSPQGTARSLSPRLAPETASRSTCPR